MKHAIQLAAVIAIASISAGYATIRHRQALPDQEERALLDTLRSMSLPGDLYSHDENFFLRNVRASLRARKEMPWGELVPEREFLHFVLPIRVNNEDLDLARPAFYEELRDRVKNLSMSEAILEVNHWCHEKATYRPSDSRTSSPLSTVSQAIGRCGEESTLAVAALRSVGIPARQIYTPRWAHTDDNHAWVEAWADGKWHFIGACEPEPVLDLAWFNAPASRGMLMNTKVAGDYDGPEEKLSVTPYYTEINVTSNYAPTGEAEVRVIDTDGRSVADADISFALYNYADFYPLATKRSDAEGSASLTAGLGDMLVWASKGDRYGIAKVTVADSIPTDVTLDKTYGETWSLDIDLVPPRASTGIPDVSRQQRDLNTLRFAQEDSIRNLYTSTFACAADADSLAACLGIDAESLRKILPESRGNHRIVSSFLTEAPATRRQDALALLSEISEKDRRDISREALFDHLLNTPPYYPESSGSREIYNRYVLNPRIEREGITPWRGILSNIFASGFSKNPEGLAVWVRDNIETDTVPGAAGMRMNPLAVFQRRAADLRSKEVFFVAAARSVGIPAEINPVTGKVRYIGADGSWHEVRFAPGAEGPVAEPGKIHLNFRPDSDFADPKYYYQFSICRIENNRPRQLEFDEYGTYSSISAENPDFAPGYYMLVTGRRLADGSVMAHCEFFNVSEGCTSDVPLIFRNDSTRISVIGNLNSESIYRDFASGEKRSILSTTGRGYFVVGMIRAGHEPSAHAINDLSLMADELGERPEKILLIFPDQSEAARFERSHFGKLPDNVVFGVDTDGEIAASLKEGLGITDTDYPEFVVADTFNRVVFHSSGYTIGTGDRLISTLRRLDQ